jgi:hypothetical protein
MAESFIQIMDMAVKQAVFLRFGPYLNLVDPNADCVFFPKTVAQREIAEKRGVGNVEFINVWRDEITFDWARQQSVIAREGIMMQYNNSSTKSEIVTVKGVPITMNYNFWVWSRDLDKLQHCTESYMNWLHDNPNIKLFYNGLYEMDMYLKFNGGVRDEGTIDTMYDKGLYYVHRYNLTMDGWALTLYSQKSVLKIILDVYLREGYKPNYQDTLLAEYIITPTSTTGTIYQ